MNTIPFYAKVPLLFISIFAVVYILYIGQGIIIPIVYATILAILLNPLVNYLVKKRVNRIVAISIAVTLATIVVVGVLYVLMAQMTSFSKSFPQLMLKLNAMSADSIHWFSDKLNVPESVIYNWINDKGSKEINHFQIREKLSQVSQILVTVVLLPVYLIMILYYKPLFLEFIRKLFRTEHHSAVAEVLTNSKKIIQTYLVGLSFEMMIIAILNTAGLLILDIEYAVLLGIMSALLNVIPYLGGIIGVGIFMLVALVTKTPIYMLYVLGLYSIIQFIDNNYIVPKIVASRVQINAFISVLVVLIGGALWGIAGMFLSIPLTAIIKVIFDHIPSLKPWGFLLGNIVPTTPNFSFKKRRN